VGLTWFGLTWFGLSRYPQYFSLFAPLEWDWNIAWNVLPLTFVYIVMIVLNNVCLRYVEVTFYQVGGIVSLVFVPIGLMPSLGRSLAHPAVDHRHVALPLPRSGH